eukprot:CAMPEP_0180152214 /NCGR_PEP_ID=MMETSP0986-20121125/22632_1 /TAXON_ID=697907 /ORGANISM="non described non described, Strain CCMP2293" /LENGTH=51 /DNA_ID=CAMNT_0022099739 /DNA_START=16 /DNA_END=168 /DNA_ORIENTATION=+
MRSLMSPSARTARALSASVRINHAPAEEVGGVRKSQSFGALTTRRTLSFLS